MVVWTLVLGTIGMEVLYSVGKDEDRNQHPLGKGEAEIERYQEEIYLKVMIRSYMSFLWTFAIADSWLWRASGHQSDNFISIQFLNLTAEILLRNEKDEFMWSFEVNEVTQYSYRCFLLFSRYFSPSNWAVSKAMLFICLNGNCEQLVALNHLSDLSWSG